MSDASLILFEVFLRSNRGLDHTHVGSVYASDHQ